MTKRDKAGRFKSSMPEEWELDCALCIDIVTGKNDPAEVARINAMYAEMRARKAA